MHDGEKTIRVAIQKAYSEVLQHNVEESARGYAIARRAWELIQDHIESGMTFETWAWGTALLENPERAIRKLKKLDQMLNEDKDE